MRYFRKFCSLKLRCPRAGFTLLEMAIGLVAVGMMTAVVMQTTGPENSDTTYAKTRAQMADMQGALERFAQKNGYYPMPASTNPASLNAQGTAVTLPNAGVANIGGVLIGAFPYATVGLPASYKSDPFNNGNDSTYRYSVSTQVTTPTNYKTYNGKGVIPVFSDKNGTKNTDSAAYTIVSHGAIAGCSTPGGNTVVNCGTASNSVYNLPFNKGTPGVNDGTVGTSNYFDDVVVYGDATQVSCSGIVRWDGSQNDTNLSSEPCEANIAVAETLGINATIIKPNTNPNNIGTATITCSYDAINKKSKLTAVGSCDCKSGQTILWSNNVNGNNPKTCRAVSKFNHTSTAVKGGAFAPISDETMYCIGTTTAAQNSCGKTISQPYNDYYGLGTARCLNGVMTTDANLAPSSLATTPSSPATTCVQNCPIGKSVSWGTSKECSATLTSPLRGAPLVTGNDDQGSVTSTNPAGSATVKCDNGVLTAQPGWTCNTPVYTGKWTLGACKPKNGSYGKGTKTYTCSGTCNPTDPHDDETCYIPYPWNRGVCQVYNSSGSGTYTKPTCSAPTGDTCDPTPPPLSGPSDNFATGAANIYGNPGSYCCIYWNQQYTVNLGALSPGVYNVAGKMAGGYGVEQHFGCSNCTPLDNTNIRVDGSCPKKTPKCKPVSFVAHPQCGNGFPG